MKRRNKAIIAILCFLLLTVTIVGIFGLIENVFDKSNGLSGNGSTGSNANEIMYNGEKYVKNRDISTLLLLGIDSMENTEDADSQQADFLVLLVMDKKTMKYKLLHINRDTMTEVKRINEYGVNTSSVTAQIALSHGYGGTEQMRCFNTVYSVRNLLYGADVDHFLSMTMDGVSVINDGLGGVTVTVNDDFSAVDPSLVKGETVTLTGRQALTYVRARGGMDDPTNLNRMERQKQYLSAMIEKLSDNDREKIADVILDANDHLFSDCTVEQLTKILSAVCDYSFDGITALEGEAVKGDSYMEYHLDEKAAQATVIDLFYKKAE